MDDDSKKNFTAPVQTVAELLKKLEDEQTIGWHGVSDPPVVEPPRPEWSVLLEQVIHIMEDYLSIYDYEHNGVGEETKEESW
jgi:hypothetical protein